MAPTIIGSEDDDVRPVVNLPVPSLLQPTTIGGQSASATKPPTVISSITSLPTKVVMQVDTPSSIPGIARNRIPVQLESLRQSHPTKDVVLQKAIHVIETTNQDELTITEAIRWGQPQQENYSNLVSESLKLAQSEVIVTVSGYIQRMMEILKGIKLEKVFEKGTGLLASALRKASKEIDTPEEFDDAMREVEQLSGLMHGRINELVSLREKLQSNSGQIESLADEVEVLVIAALVVADYFDQELSRKDISSCLQERAAGLTVTLGQIRSSGAMREIHIVQPMNLITLVQNVVFNTLPSWITSVTALRMAHHGNNKPNPTEVSEVSRILREIIS